LAWRHSAELGGEPSLERRRLAEVELDVVQVDGAAAEVPL
jgi:hypothetical protein